MAIRRCPNCRNKMGDQDDECSSRGARSLPGRMQPDTSMYDLACQFLDTARLVREHPPRIVAPSAIRVNAAFAIELFMKSLNYTLLGHPIDLEEGDPAYIPEGFECDSSADASNIAIHTETSHGQPFRVVA